MNIIVAPREDTPPREWPVWALKLRQDYEAKLAAAQRRISELEMSIMETEKANRVSDNTRALARYGDSDDVKGLTTRLQYMLPNADKLGTKGVALVAQVAIMHGLDPLPGSDHLYSWKDDRGNINVVVGYKGLLHLARKQVRFTHVSRAMNDEERAEHGLAEKEIGYITELYEIASAIECQKANIPYHPVVGSARWKPGEKIPAGRTPAWVAKKNSLKDALRQIVTTGTRLQEAIDSAMQQFASQVGAEYTGDGWQLGDDADERSLIEAGVVPPNDDGDAAFNGQIIDVQLAPPPAPPEPAPAEPAEPAPADDGLEVVFWTRDQARLSKMLDQAQELWKVPRPHVVNRAAKALGLPSPGGAFPEFCRLMVEHYQGEPGDAWSTIQAYVPSQAESQAEGQAEVNSAPTPVAEVVDTAAREAKRHHQDGFE